MFKNKTVWSADVQPIGQGINGPKIFLVAEQDIISLCVYYDLYGGSTVDEILARLDFFA